MKAFRLQIYYDPIFEFDSRFRKVMKTVNVDPTSHSHYGE
jgi:hypothetical protein